MHRFFVRPLGLLALLIAAGCTGLTMGENEPGSDTYLESGSIAVDDRTETAFVLQTACPSGSDGTSCTGTEVKTVHAVHPDDGALAAFDVTGLDDLRILFPEGKVLLMGERGPAEEELRIHDPSTLTEQSTLNVAARYHGTRMSPTRRWIAVADNAQATDPIQVIDTTTMHIEEVPHDGEWLEAMWVNGSDELVAIVFYGDDTATPSARILSWSVEEVKSLDYAVDASFWVNPRIDLTVAGARRDLLFSYTWVGISPDDQYAVFPVKQDGEHRLLVLDLVTEELRTVNDARGPVGFTPDGSTIVSYRYVPDGSGGTAPELLLLDAETLTETVMTIPFSDGPQYFVTHEGNYVVVASHLGDEQLVLYDLDNDQVTELGGPDIGLNEFVTRSGHGELWLVDDGLHRLDILNATLETVPLPWRPAHVNILSARDQLVMDDADGARLLFWSMSSRQTVSEVLLPTPAL